MCPTGFPRRSPGQAADGENSQAALVTVALTEVFEDRVRELLYRLVALLCNSTLVATRPCSVSRQHRRMS